MAADFTVLAWAGYKGQLGGLRISDMNEARQSLEPLWRARNAAQFISGGAVDILLKGSQWQDFRLTQR